MIVLSVVSLSGVYYLFRGHTRVLPIVRQLGDIKPTIPVKDNITTTIYMYRGDFSSPYHDIFALHMKALKICDKDTKTGGCDVKLKSNYKYGNLSVKTVDTLKMFCQYSEDKKTDFYVKVDDDLIMSASKLDEIIRQMAATPCQVAGSIADYSPFYWPGGQIYIYTRAALEIACKRLPTFQISQYNAEDVTFGGIINSSDPDTVCNLDAPPNHWHINYKDKRVKIHYYEQHND
ncbi:hypothetical protein GGI04_001939 [Coemansia thaxteri]|nr:hypothetical protein GGI04_001939 [Coemansia thaxteri]KAJ2470182.1 hypothetical protein GGI02_003094 [Coemansia sp. RSA 2322]KAJ2487854.1 hypothetical protein EV174_000285 [Coemansia sp. RSA 2320]